MRILLLAQFYPPVIGGEERHVRNLAVELAGRGHDVHVGCYDVHGDPPVVDPGVQVHVLPNIGITHPSLYPTADRPLAPPVPDPVATKALAALVEEVDPDVVHAHNWIVNSYLPLRAARRRPLLLSLHDTSHVCATKRLMFRDEPCSGPGLRKCFECTTDWYGVGRGPVITSLVWAGRAPRRRWVDVFLPVSNFIGRSNELDREGVDWQVVPNFVPDALLTHPRSPRDPALPTGDYLFYAGDLSDQKGVTTLVAAYALLDPATRPELMMVGRAAMDLDDLPTGARYEESWDHDRVVSGFQHCLAAVLPSKCPDACPTTVLEAMALGVPLVTTHMGGIADMVTDEESALVVEPGDATATAAAIQRVLVDADLRSRLVAQARVEVRRFLQSTVATQLEQIYTDLRAESAAGDAGDAPAALRREP